jgi:uncharacterized membrane protein YGL010W
MGLVRQHLLEWQWSDYSAKHQDRTNLRLHIVAVPLFEIAVVTLIVSRFFAEQWITFPRFVLSGGWSRNLTRSQSS